ncbi:MAG: amidohydrolase family protein [Saprospiraceae bacterium]
MRILFLLLFIVLFSSCSEKRPEPVDIPPLKGAIVFYNVQVLPMDRDTVLLHQTVVARDGRIIALGDTAAVPLPADALMIDGAGRFLMPGLTEMHAHVPPVDDIADMQRVLALFALNGVTAIRGMLGHPKHLELRELLQKGAVFGPRFYTAGPPLDGESIRTPEEARAAVIEQKRAGYDFLKVLMPGLTPPVFDAMVAAAKKESMPFAGHVPFQVGAKGAIEAGYASIDHMDGFVESLVPGIGQMTAEEAGLFGMFVADRADTSGIDALVEALYAHGIWVVPTQSLAERWFAPDVSAEMLQQEPEMIYMSKKEIKNWTNTKNELMSDPRYDSLKMVRFRNIRRQMILKCEQKGVGLLLGSDAPQVFNVPGFSIHHELQYLIAAGLSPYEALRSGTVQAGRFFGRDDMGIIAEGAVSDLILLNGNPLKDVSFTQNPEGILLGSRWVSSARRQTELKKLVRQ